MPRRSRALPPSPFRRFNSSPEVIRLVVMMYVRFPLSLRNVVRDLEQSHLPFPDLDRKGVEELLGASRLQLRMREDALRDLAQWERRSNAMRAKLRLDRRAAEHIARRIPRLEETLANLDR